MKPKKLYVFGNEFLDYDNFALKVAGKLKNARIVHCTSPESIFDSSEKDILILDVVKNSKKTLIIDDVSNLKISKMMSLHDFDLGFFLQLMKNMGINRKVKIIGIPQKGNAADIAKEVESCL